MFRSVSLMLLLGLVVIGSTQGLGAEETAEDILDNAIKSHGGKDKLERTLIGHLSGTIKSTDPRFGEGEVTVTEHFQLPKRYTRVVEGQLAGQGFRLAYAITEDKGWLQTGKGKPEPFQGKDKITIERQWYAVLYHMLLMRGKDYERTKVGESKVDGHPVVVVRVTNDKFGGELFFDKKSCLLVKTKKRFPDPLTGKEVDGENYYSEFKDVDGVQFPMKTTTWVSGKKTLEVVLKQIKFVEKLDESVFAEPKP